MSLKPARRASRALTSPGLRRVARRCGPSFESTSHLCVACYNVDARARSPRSVKPRRQREELRNGTVPARLVADRGRSTQLATATTPYQQPFDSDRPHQPSPHPWRGGGIFFDGSGCSCIHALALPRRLKGVTFSRLSRSRSPAPSPALSPHHYAFLLRWGTGANFQFGRSLACNSPLGQERRGGADTNLLDQLGRGSRSRAFSLLPRPFRLRCLARSDRPTRTVRPLKGRGVDLLILLSNFECSPRAGALPWRADCSTASRRCSRRTGVDPLRAATRVSFGAVYSNANR